MKLTGLKKAAGSLSTIEVTFKAVSTANELSIEAQKPFGFDFTGASLATTGQEIKLKNGNMIRVRVVLSTTKTNINTVSVLH